MAAPPVVRSQRFTSYWLDPDRTGAAGCIVSIQMRFGIIWKASPLELICLAPDMKSINRIMLGPDSPTYIIPADYWQAATTTGDFTLVACSVGPGFDFDDFAMASDLPDDEAMLRSNHPDLVDFL